MAGAVMVVTFPKKTPGRAKIERKEREQRKHDRDIGFMSTEQLAFHLITCEVCPDV